MVWLPRHVLTTRAIIMADSKVKATFVSVTASVIAGFILAIVAADGSRYLGFLASGIGLVAGITMAKLTPHRGGKLAIAAGVAALTGVVVSILCTALWLQPDSETLRLVANNQQRMRDAVWGHMLDHGQLPADIARQWNAVGNYDDLPEQTKGEIADLVDNRLRGMNHSEREQFVRTRLTDAWTRQPLRQRLLTVLTPDALLWTVIAIVSAAGLATVYPYRPG